ncbi:MAG TPA: hypothetical protein VHL14_05345 [Steroidobacteraceae bacterium]|nr:hypothetical protein [Steroidobacteraceae bacterium]
MLTSDFSGTTLLDELEELDTLELTELDELDTLLEELLDALLELALETGGLLYPPPPPPQAVKKIRLARSMPVRPQLIRCNIFSNLSNSYHHRPSTTIYPQSSQ